MDVVSRSKAYGLDRVDWIKVRRSLGLALAGVAITVLAQYATGIQDGTILAAGIPVVINLLRRYVQNNSANGAAAG